MNAQRGNNNNNNRGRRRGLFSAAAIIGTAGCLFVMMILLLSSNNSTTFPYYYWRVPEMNEVLLLLPTMATESDTTTTTQRRASTSTITTTTHNDTTTAAAAAATAEVVDDMTTTTMMMTYYAHPDVHTRIQYFRDVAVSLHPTTDKVGGGANSAHNYHNMYGTYLLPYYAAAAAAAAANNNNKNKKNPTTNNNNMKMLEIGLGCNMDYGPGASVSLWKKLFPLAELWEAEYVADCVTRAKERHQLDGIHVLVGDQANKDTLDEWIQTSGGNYDIVIDDGGHHNCQISNSFDKLWPQVKPGGLYFIEDMHVGKAHYYISKDCDHVIMSERLKDWIEQLIYQPLLFVAKYKHPLPADVLFVQCQAEACVVGKKKGIVNEPIVQQQKE